MNKNLATAAAMALAVIAFPSISEAKNYSWEPDLNVGDSIIYNDGQPLISREKDGYFIRILTSSTDFYGRPMINVGIGNVSLEPFNFGPENISISYGEKEGFTMAMSRQELISKVNNKAGWASFATGLLGGSTTSQTTTRTPYGTYNSRTSNPSEDYSRINGAASSVINMINQHVFATNTIPKESQYQGVAIFEKPKTQKYPISATLKIQVSDRVEIFHIKINN